MTGLSRCGRVYPTLTGACLAAELRASKSGRKFVATSCAFGDHWHVTEPQEVIGKPKRHRPDPFPPLVQKLIDKRDEGLCQRCGRETRLERHHRRAKSMGGSKARAHSQCPCNALSLCRGCHDWTHRHPNLARDDGLIVSQAVARPGAIRVARNLGSLGADFSGGVLDDQWLTCDGRWVHSPGETED